MVIHLLPEEIVNKMARQSLIKFALYQPHHTVEARPLQKVVSYYSDYPNSKLHQGFQHDFSLEFEAPKIARVQFIEVKDEFKAKREETQLYSVVHNLAWRLGSEFVRIAPMDIATKRDIEEYRDFLRTMNYVDQKDGFFDRSVEKTT